MQVLEIIRRPLVSEKSARLIELFNQYTFEVALGFNKAQIAHAVETAFDVSVLDVRVIKVRGKIRRVGRSRGMTSSWAKAVVSVKPGDKISVFEGV